MAGYMISFPVFWLDDAPSKILAPFDTRWISGYGLALHRKFSIEFDPNQVAIPISERMSELCMFQGAYLQFSKSYSNQWNALRQQKTWATGPGFFIIPSWRSALQSSCEWAVGQRSYCVGSRGPYNLVSKPGDTVG